MYFGVKI